MKIQNIILVCVLFSVAGCIGPKPQRGGRSEAELPGVKARMEQPENPKDSSEQNSFSKYEMSFVAPAGSRIEVTAPLKAIPSEVVRGEKQGSKGSGSPALPSPLAHSIVLSQPTLITIRQESGIATRVGGSFADVARALTARLAAARPVQYAGIAFIACAVALFYFGWPKIGACAVIAGIGMIVLSMVLPGNERWILGGFVAFFVVASAALLIGWYKGKDENGNHVPDWVESLLSQLKGGSK